MEVVFFSDCVYELKILKTKMRWVLFDKTVWFYSVTSLWVNLLRAHVNSLELLIVKLFYYSRFRQVLMEIVNRLSLLYKFKVVFLFEANELHSDSYVFSKLPAIILKLFWQSLCLNKPFVLNRFVVSINSIIAASYSGFNVSRLEHGLGRSYMWHPKDICIFPSTQILNNVILSCYEFNTAHFVVSYVFRKILFRRLRPIVFVIKTSCHVNVMLRYMLFLKRYVCHVMLSFVCFCNLKLVNVYNVVVLQLVISNLNLKQLIKVDTGLSQRECWYKIILPEMEGKQLVDIVAFNYFDEVVLLKRRVNSVVLKLLCWVLLSRIIKFSVIFMFSNYPILDNRIGNGVGLNTTESVVNLINIFGKGVSISNLKLWRLLLSGITNYSVLSRRLRLAVNISYAKKIALNEFINNTILCKWGELVFDPFVLNQVVCISVFRFSEWYFAIQPTRGYGLVCPQIYHSAFLIPPFYYWLFYLSLKYVCCVSVLVNVGKHGNLEWLPGKAVFLSENCFPNVFMGNLPNGYFYVVNDPGEGTQAKRRTGSVIIDHSIAPLCLSTCVSVGVNDYNNFKIKYVCNLSNVQFKAGLHTIGWNKQTQKLKIIRILYKQLLLKVAVLNCSIDWFCLFNLNKNFVFRKLLILSSACCFSEVYSFLRLCFGRYVLSGVSSGFTRAKTTMLPTGRNFYCENMDMPTPASFCVGSVVANKIVKKYYNDTCRWLTGIGISVWGTSNMRTGGDDISIIMSLLGVRPIWKMCNLRVIGFEVLPLCKIRRFRVKSFVRVSGLFRDVFFSKIEYLQLIFDVVLRIGECPLGGTGRYWNNRIFCCAPKSYGVGIQEFLDAGIWKNVDELAKKYIVYGSYVFVNGVWKADVCCLIDNLKSIQIVLHSQDNYEHDILDSDDYYQFEGGMKIATRFVKNSVENYHVDTSNSFSKSIKIRKLKYELDRLVKAKLTNLDWVNSLLFNNQRGVAELLANINYLFYYAVTTMQVTQTQYHSVFNTFIKNKRVFSKFKVLNAEQDLKLKFNLALQRQVWRPSSNRYRYYLS